MASNVIGHATLNVVPGTKGFGSALKGQVDPLGASAGKSSGSALGGAFKGAIGPLMAAAGVVGMGAFVKSVTGKASDLNESLNAINVMFGEAGGGITDLGKRAAASLGLSQTAFNGLATQFAGAVKNIAGPGGDVVGIMDDLTTRASDFASVMNLDVADAATLFQQALAGETEGMRRYGKDMSAAAVEAYALANGIGDGTGELTEAMKQQARYGLLMQETAVMAGDFANTSDQLANSQRILGATWENVQTQLGQAFLPFATAAMQVLSGMMPTLQAIGDAFSGFGERMAVISTAAGGGLAGIQAMLSSIGGSIIEWVTGGGIQAMVAGFSGLRDSLLHAVLTGLPGILEGLISMAPGILSAAAASFQSLALGLIQSVPPLIATLLGIAPSLISTLLSMVPMLLSSALTLFMGIVQGLTTAVPLILGAIVLMLPQIATSFVTMLPGIVTAALSMFMGVVQALLQLFPVLIPAVLSLLPLLATTLVGMLPSIVTAALEMFMGLVQAVLELLPVLIETVLTLLPVLMETILGMLPGILESGLTMFLGLVTAVLEMLPELITTLIGILPDLVTTIVSMIPTLLSTGIDLFLQLAVAVLDALPEIVGAIVTEVIPALVGAVIDAVPKLLRAGNDLIGGLISGLWESAGKVGAALLDIIGDATDGFLEWLGIKSPSRLFMGFGEHVGGGLAIGITSMEKDVAAAAFGLASAAADAVKGQELTIDAGVAARTASALADIGVGEKVPHYATTYNDYSTSHEDKQAKLQRAQTTLERSVAATLRR